MTDKKSDKNEETSGGWSRQYSGITDLMIVGGSSKPSSTLEDLALLLLYSPRYMESESKIEIPAWSAASKNRHQFGQLRGSPVPTVDGLCKSAADAYDYLQKRPKRDRSERPANWSVRERSWQIGWKQAAAIAVMDAGIATAGSPGPLRFAPFWIRLGRTGESVPAYALRWHRGNQIELQFVVRLADRYSCLAFSDDDQDDNTGWMDAYDRYDSVVFDPTTRADTVWSAALGAADSTSKHPIGVGIIRDVWTMPNELIGIVVDYLTIPPIPAAMVDWLAAQRPVC